MKISEYKYIKSAEGSRLHFVWSIIYVKYLKKPLNVITNKHWSGGDGKAHYFCYKKHHIIL
jgi:hypothetical protein